jgi:hypothetical protein
MENKKMKNIELQDVNSQENKGKKHSWTSSVG